MTGKRDSRNESELPGSAAFNAALRDATDRCVKCALCLPHCPTYALKPTETESPRGRISLIAALANGDLAPAEAQPSLDSCLSCRACEQVCPAQVEYGSVLDRGKSLINAPRRTERWASALLRRPALVRLLGALWRRTRWLPLPRQLARWQALPGDAGQDTKPRPGPAPRGAPVTLLTGCLSDTFDAAAVAALVELFAAVDRPCTLVAGCCGALDQHSGASAQAHAQSRALRVNIPDDASPIVHLASGCAATVHDSPELRARVTDPFSLLAELNIHEKLATDAKSVTTVALHLPCTQRNVLRAGTALANLFASLKDVSAKPVEGVGCCGAAGAHMLRDPDTAAAMAGHALDQVMPETSVLVSANIGCAWHLRGALFDRERKLPVEHPAVFLARRLARGT